MDSDKKRIILLQIIVKYYLNNFSKILIPLKIPDQILNCSLFFTLLLDVQFYYPLTNILITSSSICTYPNYQSPRFLPILGIFYLYSIFISAFWAPWNSIRASRWHFSRPLNLPFWSSLRTSRSSKLYISTSSWEVYHLLHINSKFWRK